MTDFVKEGRVGDRVWSIHVIVDFFHGGTEKFTKYGELYDTEPIPTLFWDKPQIIAPEKPVRKVKRWIAGFYSFTGLVSLYGSGIHPILFESESECPKDSAFKAEVEIDENYV
jgi:hypothetical protein